MTGKNNNSNSFLKKGEKKSFFATIYVECANIIQYFHHFEKRQII